MAEEPAGGNDPNDALASSEDAVEPTEDTVLPSDAPSVPASGNVKSRPYPERAVVALRRARKSLGPDWTKTDERFDFHIAEANVYALLGLTEAIRGRDESD